MTNITTNNLETEYQQFVIELIELVQQHRVQAVQAVQAYTNQLYWQIGELIINRQKEHGWGKSIVKQLSIDLNHNLGEGISWSPRNLWFMRQLVEEYSNVKQSVSLLESTKVNQLDSLLENIKQLVSNVPWQHNVLILQKVKDPKARIFYLQSTIKNQYSRSVLLHQIKTDAYSNFLLHPTQHNFATTLPEHLMEQTKESIKSVYSLDFLDINKPISERELESSMVENVKLKQPDDKPSIGILLVPYKDHLEVEYALRSASKPIGIAEYTLSKKLPNDLKGKLPSAEDFKKMILNGNK